MLLTNRQTNKTKQTKQCKNKKKVGFDKIFKNLSKLNHQIILSYDLDAKKRH